MLAFCAKSQDLYYDVAVRETSDHIRQIFKSFSMENTAQFKQKDFQYICMYV